MASDNGTARTAQSSSIAWMSHDTKTIIYQMGEKNEKNEGAKKKT